MTSQKVLHYVYGLAILFFVVGVLSYAAFSKRAPDLPVRLMFTSIAGKVLFHHKTHSADSGFGVSCYDCHHHVVGDEAALLACGRCHTPLGKIEAVKTTCLECHGEKDIQDAQLPKRADALHAQCIGCHQQYGAGPQECSSCHVL